MNAALKKRLNRIEKAIAATQRAQEREAEMEDELRRQMKLTHEDREVLRQADEARARGEYPNPTPELQQAYRHLGHDLRLRLKLELNAREMKPAPARGHSDESDAPEGIISILNRARDRHSRPKLSEV